jgi:heme exporter protein B
MYFTALLLGASGFAGIFTLISAISARTNNTMGIMAILGFPLILPLLTTLILLSDVSLRGLTWEYGYREVMILGGINVLVAALSYLLFPYLWRE